jgi:hypothetical protein
MTSEIASQTGAPFSLSATAAEIRKVNENYQQYHDDWECLAEWCDEISPFVNLDKIDWDEIQKKFGEVGPRAKRFLETVYAKRKILLEKAIPEAQLAFDELKSRVVTLLKEDEELKKCLTLASDGVSNAFSMITTIEALRVAMVGYYKWKSDGEEPDLTDPEKPYDEGDRGKHCEQLGEVAFLGIKALMDNQPIPDEIFTATTEQREGTDKIKAPLQSFSKLFVAVNPTVRTELIGRFKKVMRGLLACFSLYRLPVNVGANLDPVFPARFMPAVVLGTHLELFGLNLASFTVTAT